MIKGCKKLLVKITLGDEAGIYRINEEGKSYLAFAFDSSREAIKIGSQMAAILRVPIKKDLSEPITTPDRGSINYSLPPGKTQDLISQLRSAKDPCQARKIRAQLRRLGIRGGLKGQSKDR